MTIVGGRQGAGQATMPALIPIGGNLTVDQLRDVLQIDLQLGQTLLQNISLPIVVPRRLNEVVA